MTVPAAPDPSDILRVRLDPNTHPHTGGNYWQTTSLIPAGIVFYPMGPPDRPRKFIAHQGDHVHIVALPLGPEQYDSSGAMFRLADYGEACRWEVLEWTASTYTPGSWEWSANWVHA